MGQREKFDYGDAVRVIKGDHTGRVGAIVGINDSSSDFTIEFGDGTDAQLPSEELEKLPD
jgi:ribosomal protein L24